MEDIELTSIPEKVTFSCELSQELLITETPDWYKNDKPIRKSDKYEIKSKGTKHELIIHDVDGKSLGNYKCSYKNEETTGELIINTPPTCKLPKKYESGIILKVGQAFVIEIPFQGCPQPSVKWHLNEKPITDVTRITVDTIFNMTSLSLSKAKKSDTGNFTLILENKHGKISINVKVKVIDRPDPIRNPVVKDMNATQVFIGWNQPEFDGGSEITGYVIEKREGYKKMWQKAGTTKNLEFLIDRLVEGNSYSVRIFAENEVGLSEEVELPSVIVPKSQFCKFLTYFFVLEKNSLVLIYKLC